MIDKTAATQKAVKATKAKEIAADAWWLENKVFKGLWMPISNTRYLGGWSQGPDISTGEKPKDLQLDSEGVHLKGAFKTIFTIPWTEVKAVGVEEIDTNNRPSVQDYLTSQTKRPDKQAVVVVSVHSGEDALFLVERFAPEELRTKLALVISHVRSARERGPTNPPDETPAPVSVAAKKVPKLANGLAEEENLIEQLPDRIETALSKLLSPNEKVLVKLKGAFKEGLICTDSRVMIVKAGLMTGQMLGNEAFQVPYTNISGIQVKYHLMSGYFELSAGGMQNTTKSYWSSDRNSDPSQAPNCVSLNTKAQREKFQEACSFILTKMNGPIGNVVTSANDDIFTALEKLGQLKEAGIVSEEEFASKKAELLQRL